MEELFEDLFQGNVRVVDRGKEVESLNKSSDLAMDFVDFIDEDVPYEEWDSKQIDNSAVVCEDQLEEEDMDWGVLDKDDCVNERALHLECVPVRRCLVEDLRATSLLGTGFLARLLDPPSTKPSTTVAKVFGCQFVLSSFKQEVWTKIFMLIRKELLAGGSQGSTSDCQRRGIAILTALEILSTFFSWFSSLDVTTTDEDVMKSGSVCIVGNITALVNQLDPLETHLQTPGCNREASGPVGWGMVLGCYVRCHILGCLYGSVRLKEASPVLLNLFTDYLNHVLEELVAFSVAVYRSQCGAHPPSPCLYECVLELWLVIIHTLDGATALRLRQHGFWATLKQFLSSVLSGDRAHSSESSSFDSVWGVDEKTLSLESCWWLVASLAQLYCYDVDGQFTSNPIKHGACSEDWTIVSAFLLPKCLECESPTDCLTSSLRYLVELSVLWTPNRDVLLHIWDHIHKALESSPLPTFDTQGGDSSPILSPTLITSKQLVNFTNTITSISSVGEVEALLGASPWFCYYLTVLSVTFNKSNPDHLWKQIKGRFFSKFHKKRLLELTSVGLGNFILLYLALSKLGNLDDVGSQLASLLVSLGPTHPACRYMDVIWSGLFALLLVYMDSNSTGARHHTEKLTALVDNLASCCKPSSTSSGLLRQAALSVMQGTLDLFALSALTSMHVELFSTGLCQIMCCFLTSSDCKFVVEGILHLVRLFISHQKRLNNSRLVKTGEESSYLAKCTNVFFSDLLPGLSSKVEEPYPPQELMDVAVQLTAFCTSSGDGSLGQRDHLTRLVEGFGFKDSVTPSFAARFLTHVLSQEWSSNTWLSSERAQLHMLHTWIRCIIQMHYPPGAQEEVAVLTRLLPKLPFVSTIMRNGRCSLKSEEEPLTVMKVVLTAMNGEVSRSPNLQTAAEWYQKGLVVFNDLLKIMEKGLSGELPSKAMDMCFAAGGVIVSSCPRVVYSRSALQCLLPKLVDVLVMPISHPRRPVTAGVYQRIKRNLHHFIDGLLSLDPQRDDFIRRKIKQMFGKYFLSYCQQSQPNPLMNCSPNPFMVLLHPSFKPSPSREAISNLLFVVEMVISLYFRIPVQVTSVRHVVVFLNSAFSQTVNSEVLARCCLVILPAILTCLHACESSKNSTESKETKKYCTFILRRLLTGCDKARGIIQITQLHDCMREYMEAHFGRQNHVTVFKPIEVIINLNRSLVEEFLPIAWHAVEQYEMKSGSGRDRVLRSAYQNLVEAVSREQ